MERVSLGDKCSPHHNAKTNKPPSFVTQWVFLFPRAKFSFSLKAKEETGYAIFSPIRTFTAPVKTSSRRTGFTKYDSRAHQTAQTILTAGLWKMSKYLTFRLIPVEGKNEELDRKKEKKEAKKMTPDCVGRQGRGVESINLYILASCWGVHPSKALLTDRKKN